jgi:dihydrofolate reductase
MRKVTFGVANSLDNFIARQDHAVDWLVWDEEVASISAEFWQTIDTVVMGRKTYEVMLASGTTAYAGVKNYVFSRTLQKSADEAVEIRSQDAAEFVRTLKQQEGKGICVTGGGELAKALFEAGLIDEIGLNIQPVLLGSGIPLFYEMSRQLDLQLLNCRVLKNGGVYVLYQVNSFKQTKAEL